MTLNASAFVSRERLQVVLAETLGWEKSREVIDRALAELGIEDTPILQQSQVEQLLDHLGGAHGLPGVAARFARRRLDPGTPSLPQIPVGVRDPSFVDEEVDTTQMRRSIADDIRIEIDDLVELLSPSIDVVTSRAAIQRTVAALGLASNSTWSLAQGMAIMELLSKEPGLVGVVSRLGKARLRLSPVSRGPARTP